MPKNYMGIDRKRGYTAQTTRLQREALKKVWDRDLPSPWGWGPEQEYPCIAHYEPRSYLEFRRTVVPGSGCIMLPWRNMWLGIEPDGYTHS